MHDSIRLTAVTGLLAFASFAQAQNANLLWYAKPATDWETEALPIGNGRIGAMVFGGVGFRAPADLRKVPLDRRPRFRGGL